MKLVEVRGSWPNIHVNKYKKKPDDGQYCDLISCGLISWHRSSEKNRNIYIYGCFQFWVEYEKQYTFGPIKTYNIWIN